MSKRKWDLTSSNSVRGAVEWLRKRSDAIVVMVIRGHDYAFEVDGNVAPSDAAELVRELLPEMIEQTNRERIEKREAETRKRAAEITGR